MEAGVVDGTMQAQARWIWHDCGMVAHHSMEGRANQAPAVPGPPLQLGSQWRVHGARATCMGRGHRLGPTAASNTNPRWSAAIVHRRCTCLLGCYHRSDLGYGLFSGSSLGEPPPGSTPFSKGNLDRTSPRSNPNRVSNTFDVRCRCRRDRYRYLGIDRGRRAPTRAFPARPRCKKQLWRTSTTSDTAA